MVGCKLNKINFFAMKNYSLNIFKYIFILNLIIILFSCEKPITTDDPSFITYYVEIKLKGTEIMTVPLGSNFVDPGWIATENNIDVSDKVSVVGEVNTNKLGLYNLTYIVKNKDGFPSSTIRKVIVYDPNAPDIDISGIYKSKVVRTNNNETYEDLPITITKIAPGFFYISDFLGGFYAQGRNYGSNYAMSGYFSINNDYTLTLVESFIPGWGMTLKKLEGYYDTNDGSLNLKSYFSSFEFLITLTK